MHEDTRGVGWVVERWKFSSGIGEFFGKFQHKKRGETSGRGGKEPMQVQASRLGCNKSGGSRWILRSECPCKAAAGGGGHRKQVSWVRYRLEGWWNGGGRRRGLGANCIPIKKDAGDVGRAYVEGPVEVDSRHFVGYQEDPMVGKLRSQIGMIHPIPTPPANRNVAGLFVLFFFCGVVFEKVWNSGKRLLEDAEEGRVGMWPQVPRGFSQLLEKDLQRKESVEWVNMVVGKLWKVYREGLENWIVGLLQPVIDGLQKPDYVTRVEIKQFSLGEEPLSVRNVERKTSRRANDLQYQVGIRYTGDARMLLSLKLKFGIIPVVVPVGIRDFDIDGELWVKLQLIRSEPWVGNAALAFASLPKIKFELAPFRLFNLMAIPVLSMFLLKLLTEDLPRLFVRPKKIVLDFQSGQALGPIPEDFVTVQEKNKHFVGELSVTLVDARNLPYVSFAKTDPYVILRLGDQIIRSKKNSQTTVIGPSGAPIWNQDFHMLVADPRKEKLNIQVRDSLGLVDFTVGIGEVDLVSLQDTVPTDRVVSLQSGLGFLTRRSSSEVLLHLTYKAYVEDEEDDSANIGIERDISDSEILNVGKSSSAYPQRSESFMDVLTTLLLSDEFQGIMASESGSRAYESPSKGAVPSMGPHGLGVNSSLEDPESDSVLRDPTWIWLAVMSGLLILVLLKIGELGC